MRRLSYEIVDKDGTPVALDAADEQLHFIVVRSNHGKTLIPLKQMVLPLAVYRSGGNRSRLNLTDIANVDSVRVIVDGIVVRGGFLNVMDVLRSDNLTNTPLLHVQTAGGRAHFRHVGAKGWAMHGGNFAYTHDSRGPDFPLAIHDRYEGEFAAYEEEDRTNKTNNTNVNETQSAD